MGGGLPCRSQVTVLKVARQAEKDAVGYNCYRSDSTLGMNYPERACGRLSLSLTCSEISTRSCCAQRIWKYMARFTSKIPAIATIATPISPPKIAAETVTICSNRNASASAAMATKQPT